MEYRTDLEIESYKEPLKFISRYLKDGDHILEIGAKWGRHAEMITNQFKVNYIIYDLNDDRDCCFGLPFYKVNAAFDTFPDKDNTFDLVFSSHTLEHVPNYQHFFQESLRVLKKGGYMIVIYPNFSSIFQRLLFLKNGVPSRLGGNLSDAGHLNFIPYKFLIGYLQNEFSLKEVKSHSLVDIIFCRKLMDMFKKPNKELIKTESPLWGYNIMLCFQKK